ncbi:hypothetical protein MNBD_GAMMA11-2753 [hydrothermal vent metagenome]|uniref:Uncharacterized protein n=1 Tax=hydrothermal vent metagenome TaxID=652676 RepID=A0A3B0XF51_9ZZZZ
MKYFNKALIVLLVSVLSACAGPTPKEVEDERVDKEGAVINAQLAGGYIRRGDLEIAKEKLLKSIKLDSTYVPAYTTMAVLMTMINKPIEAENYYLQALDLDPENPELLNNYGTFLCKNKKYSEAFEMFDKVLANSFYETPEVVQENYGYCLLQNDKPDYKAAEEHLRQALKANPEQASALLAMAELGIATKKYLMVRAYTQRYHALARASAHSLWVQIQAEHALNDRKYFLQLSKKLMEHFPRSNEASLLMKLPPL